MRKVICLITIILTKMKYTTESGIIVMSEKNPVIHKEILPDHIHFIVGTYESFETGPRADGGVQQIKVIREYSESGLLTVTIIEQTQEEIKDYNLKIQKEMSEHFEALEAKEAEAQEKEIESLRKDIEIENLKSELEQLKAKNNATSNN